MKDYYQDWRKRAQEYQVLHPEESPEQVATKIALFCQPLELNEKILWLNKTKTKTKVIEKYHHNLVHNLDGLIYREAYQTALEAICNTREENS